MRIILTLTLVTLVAFAPLNMLQAADQPRADQPAAVNAQSDNNEFRQYLLDSVAYLESVQHHMPLRSISDGPKLDEIYQLIMLLSDEQLSALSRRVPPLDVLKSELSFAMSHPPIGPLPIDTVKVIDFPEPDYGLCALFDGASTLGFLTTWGTLKEILAALKWECLETALGENLAEGCVAPVVAVTYYEFIFKAAEGCLKQQRHAVLDASLETNENIASHLDSYIDATISSRASQASADDLQSSVTTALDGLDSTQSSLDADVQSADVSLLTILQDLDDLTTDTNALESQASDIQFRVQVNQVDIEDAQVRVADIQERVTEIRDDTQTILAAITVLQNTLATQFDSVNANAEQEMEAVLAQSLANPDRQVLRFKLPGFAGGELESSREILIQAIVNFEAVGAKTLIARNLLFQGDVAYNHGQYLAAYGYFASSYQSLTTTTSMGAGK